MKTLLKCLVLCAISLQTFADDFVGIEVSGKAEISAIPDVFTSVFTISERAVSSSKAKALVDQKSQLLVKQALSLTIDNQDIESERITIVPVYIDNDTELPELSIIEKQANNSYVKIDNVNKLQRKHNQQKKKLVYQVSRVIVVHLTDINTYEKLLNKATSIGINRVSPLQMSISKAQQLYQQALEQAIVNATEKATVMAKHTGKKLGHIVYLKEQSYGAPARMMSAMSDERFQPNVGKKAISAHIIAKFALVN
ncbi:SIMPL domain-containing protein [Thalassotalea sp. PLHSN55]|uniref:SIMPL domain-containing protein n=1 Tax=Thalassotalea sp. PLHSN55 TaxID=3435888 RepID=UPI003F83854F